MRKNVDFVYLLIVFCSVPVFYWSLFLAKVLPTGDGAIPLSFYSYLYTGYSAHKTIFLWNPFLIGGAIDNIITYIYMGFSPLNPILHLWLPVSTFFKVNVLNSFYIYYLLHIFLSAAFAYFIGRDYFFKNKFSAFFFSLSIVMSGYFVSMLGLIYYIVPFSWFIVTLFFGLRFVNNPSIRNAFLLALSASIFVINGPTVVIPSIIYLVTFLLVQLVFRLRELGVYSVWKTYLSKLLIAFFMFIVLIAVPAYLYIKFVSVEGYHLTGDVTTFFLGKRTELDDSSNSLDFNILLNTFIPNKELNRWFDYGNLGLWYNGFYYLSFISPILIGFGAFYLMKSKHLCNIALALLICVGVSIFFTQGHTFLKIFHPYLNLLLKYPKFSMPLLIFTFLVLMSYGFHSLFTFDLFRTAYFRRLFVVFVPILCLSVALIFVFIKYFVPNIAIPEYPLRPHLSLYLYTLSYCLFISFLYIFAFFSKNKYFFALVIFLDLFFYLSSSWPLVAFPNVAADSTYSASYINTNRKFVMPTTINYSLPYTYPGMHFAVSPTFFRETSIPEVSMSLMNKRRAYWGDWILNTTFNDNNVSKLAALNTLGVLRSRYFIANEVFTVDSYAEIYPKLEEIYSSFYSKNNYPLFRHEPIVVNESDPPVLGGFKYEIASSIPRARVKHYISDYADENNDIAKIDLNYENFEDVDSGLYRYTGTDIPAVVGFLTENNVQEHLCGYVTNGEIHFFPLSGDIFNFTGERRAANINYIIDYSDFYATYLMPNGKIGLFVRTANKDNLKNLKLNYSTSCLDESTRKYQINTHEYTDYISKDSFSFNRSTNNYAVYASDSLINSHIPSYMSDHVARYKLYDSITGKEISKFDPLKRSNLSYILKGSHLEIYASIQNNPYLDQRFNIKYTVVDSTVYTDNVHVVKENPDKIILDVDSGFPSILVARNIYSPYWKITVNGKKINPLVVNGLYMGIPIEAGKNAIILEYNPLFLKQLIQIVPIYALLIPVLFLLSSLKNKSKSNSFVYEKIN